MITNNERKIALRIAENLMLPIASKEGIIQFASRFLDELVKNAPSIGSGPSIPLYLQDEVREMVERLRRHALPDPHDEREVLHAPMLKEAANLIEKLAGLK